MLISLLGELEVLDDDGRPVAITGAKQRVLLAMLALHAGQMVPADQLVEALWGEDPPPAVRNGVQGLVSKLRRLLGPAFPIVMRGGGYAIDVPADAVDAHRFEQLVAQGRAARASGDLAAGSRCSRRPTRCGGERPSPTSRTRSSPPAHRRGGRSCASRRWRNGSMPSSSSDGRARLPSWRRWSPRIPSGNAFAGC